MEIFETTYKIKLISSKNVRAHFNKCVQELCDKNDCKCEIQINAKWFWVFDHFIIKIIGNKINIEIIETQLKLLTTLI
jgi:hypothetical protein